MYLVLIRKRYKIKKKCNRFLKIKSTKKKTAVAFVLLLSEIGPVGSILQRARPVVNELTASYCPRTHMQTRTYIPHVFFVLIKIYFKSKTVLEMNPCSVGKFFLIQVIIPSDIKTLLETIQYLKSNNIIKHITMEIGIIHHTNIDNKTTRTNIYTHTFARNINMQTRNKTAIPSQKRIIAE